MSNNMQNEYTGVFKTGNLYTPLDKAYQYTCFPGNDYYKGINNPTTSCLCSTPFKRTEFDDYQQKGKQWPKNSDKLGWRIY